MKKLVLLIVITGLSLVASNANAGSSKPTFVSNEKKAEKDKLGLGYWFLILPKDGDGTTGIYVNINWNATTSSTKYLSIYESDDENNLGNFVAEYSVEKGVPGSHVFLTYKYPGMHYVTIVDEKGNELDKVSYYVQ